MPPSQQTLDTLAAFIATEFKLTFDRAVVCDSDRRTVRASRVFTIALRTPTGLKRFVVKSGDNLDQAMILANRARAAFDGDPGVFLPRCALEPRLRLFVSENFVGHSLRDVCEWPRRCALGSGVAAARRAIVRAGRWLRKYHATSMRPAAHEQIRPYLAYLDRRRGDLGLLPKPIADNLCQMAEHTTTQSVAILHGDFAPHNILIGNGKLCIIDFGLEEGIEAPPAWDVAILLTDLERIFALSRFSALHWLHAEAQRMLAALLEAYGPIDVEAPAFRTAVALRHFVGLSGATSWGPKYAPIARWHLRRIEQLTSGAPADQARSRPLLASTM